MELWDAYDEKLNKIDGTTLIRGEKIPDGMFHLVCDVLVRHIDGDYLITRRDLNKIPSGGMWEATAGGSAIAGESAPEAASRELYEETGIIAKNITRVGTVVNNRNNTIYALFLCVTDIDKNAIVLQEGETIDYRWISGRELMSMPQSVLTTHRIQPFIDDLKT